jgi:hypothetical protein
MFRWVVLASMAALLGGCSSFSFYTSSSKAINGNNTGGIVPPTVTNEADQIRDAQAHCAQYNKQMRVTARASETGGKMIFVCEAPGTPPPPVASTGAPPPSGQGDLPPGVKMKKK